MRNMEDSLRTAIEELAAEAPLAHDLTAVARTRGRRLRRRRRAMIGACALALVMAVAAPYTVLRDARSAPQPPAQKPTATPTRVVTGNWWESPYQLPGGAIVTTVSSNNIDEPATLEEGDVVLDRSTGRYRAVDGNYGAVTVAPAGEYVMAQTATGSSVLILDGQGNEYDRIKTDTVMEPQWSPDGSRLLITTGKGYVLYTVATRQALTKAMPEAHRDCPQLCFFTWLPNGREIAIGLRDPATKRKFGKPDKLQGIRIYSPETGTPVRTLPVPGVPVGVGAWSPDGRTVLAYNGDAYSYFSDETYLFDVTTGAEIAAVSEGLDGIPQFLPNGQVIVFGTERSLATRIHDGATGQVVETITVPPAFGNRRVGIGLP
jgi:hypothetical protein